MRADQLKGLKLHQALPFINYNIKVGCDDGTGFVYCGEVPKAIDVHDIDLFLIEKQEKSIENAKKELDVFIAEMSVLEQKINKAINNVYAKQTRLQQRSHLLQRRIVETYKSIDEANTYIIKIEGDDRGDYWTTNEYKTGKVETDE